MAALAYIPVLHEGYKRFIEEYGSEELWLIGEELTRDFKPIAKEIRALSAAEIACAVGALGWCEQVRVLMPYDLMELLGRDTPIICADEDITHEVCEQYLPGVPVIYESIFLRWDRHRTVGENEVNPDRTVSTREFDCKVMRRAHDVASHSADWWRHVGSVLVDHDGVVYETANQPVPSQHTPYANGDPRNNFSRGVNLELSTVIHAEARVIAEMARRGMSVEGMSLYVTTFPCPPCAKLIAYSGISRLFYATGYSLLDGESILRSQGVEIILVDMENPPTS